MSGSKVYKWAFIDRVGIAVLNLGGNIVLARLLTEADFGLLAMIAIFVAVAADLSSCGLSDGIIHKVNPTREDYSTVFVANTVMGLIFGSAFFFGAPLMASFFHQPELLNITRVLGVCFFFQCMSFTQETYDSLIEMLAWLTDKYDLESKDILRHYDCGGKKCPIYYVEHEDAWQRLLDDVEHFTL